MYSTAIVDACTQSPPLNGTQSLLSQSNDPLMPTPFHTVGVLYHPLSTPLSVIIFLGTRLRLKTSSFLMTVFQLSPVFTASNVQFGCSLCNARRLSLYDSGNASSDFSKFTAATTSIVCLIPYAPTASIEITATITVAIFILLFLNNFNIYLCTPIIRAKTY